MSRSFGDLWACRAGVIQKPEIKDYKLTKYDRAIVLASDGVWEFLSNDDVMKILVPYIQTNQEDKGLSEVIKASVNHWKNEDVVIDDITIVLAVINMSSKQLEKTIEVSSHIQSQSDAKTINAYKSIPDFHISNHY